MGDEKEELLRQFTEDFLEIIDAFIGETSELKQFMARMETQFEYLKEDVESITKVVRDGNGQKPMMARIEVIEEKLREDEKHQKMRWDLVLAAAPGIIAMIAMGLGG